MTCSIGVSRAGAAESACLTRTMTPSGTSPASSPSSLPVDSGLLSGLRDLPARLPGVGEPPIPEFEGRFIESGDRMVYLRSSSPRSKRGNRQAVFVHGLGGSGRNWTDLMHLLAPTVDGLAVDLPGFGRSPMPADGEYSQDAHAATVVRIIEDRCLGPIDLFGNSMGGAIAVRIAATRPDLVRSLVLISPALPDLRPRRAAAPVVIMATPGLREMAGLFADPGQPENLVDQMLRTCYADPGIVPPERREVLIEETRWRMGRVNAQEPFRMSARGLARTFRPRHSENGWSMASAVVAPTLVTFGSHDKLVDSRLANRAAKTFKNSRVVTLPEVGHMAQVEAAETVARLVLMLWAESDAAGQTGIVGQPDAVGKVSK